MMHDPLDPSPFRRRVSELMSRPLRTCGPGIPVAEAARHMASLGISALSVAEGGRLVGIVSERDLVAKVLARGWDVNTPVHEVMSVPVITCRTEDFFATALLTMVRHRVKHLPVLDASGTPVGMITMGDLTRRRDLGALAVANGIEWAPDIQALVAVREKADEVIRALWAARAHPAELLAVATEFNDRLVRRCVVLAEQVCGPAPVPYAFLVMGSLGRGEQFVRTDQDNGLVWLDPPPDRTEAVQDYFIHRLGARIVVLLEKCGFALCPGGVMANSPTWSRSLRDWQRQLTAWADEPTPERVRAATIFLDFRAVAGDLDLGAQLRAATLPSGLFLHHLVQDDLSYRVPLGPFGMLLAPLWGPRRGEVNLKGDACVHLVDGLRVLALKQGTMQTGTLERLHQLAERKEIDHSFAEWLESAFNTLMAFRITRGLQGEPNPNTVRIDELSERERTRLREALVAVSQLQDHLGITFRAGEYR